MNSKKEKKTIVGLVVSIIALLMFTITMTFAYFTANSSATSSTMTFGTLSIDTEGLTAGQKSATCGSPAHTLVPGCTIDLSAPVSVTGNIDALLRAQLTATVYKTNGVDSNTVNALNCKIDNNRVVEDAINGTFYALKSEATSVSNGQNPSFAEQVFNLANTASYSGWTYSDDGYYYYNKVVNGTSVNSGTFATSFTLPANTMGNDWQGAYVQFGIVLQAIQAEHLVNANNKKITFTKDNENVITSVSVESGATITVGNDITLEDVFGVINGVAAWEAVESESTTAPPAPDPAEASLGYMEFVVLDSDGYRTEAVLTADTDVEMSSLNDIKSNNANLMTDGTKFVGIYASDELDDATNSNANEAVDLIVPSYVKIVNDNIVLADVEDWENDIAYKVIRIISLDYEHRGFYGKNIGTLTIPETIKYIDTYTFNNCNNITNVYYNAVNAVVTEFYDELTNSPYRYTADPEDGGAIISYDFDLVIGSAVQVIPSDLFSNDGSSGVKSIDFSNATSLTTLQWSAFASSTLITSLVLPSSLETIGMQAFYCCRSLISVTIPASVETIDSQAFEGDEVLLEVYNLSNLVIIAGEDNDDYGQLGKYAKVINTNINTPSRVSVSNNVVYYVDGNDKIAAALVDKYQENVTLANDCTEISEDIFFESSLKNLVVPTSVTRINKYAFSECTYYNALTINYIGTSAQWDAITLFDGSNETTIAQYYTQYNKVFPNAQWVTATISYGESD